MLLEIVFAFKSIKTVQISENRFFSTDSKEMPSIARVGSSKNRLPEGVSIRIRLNELFT